MLVEPKDLWSCDYSEAFRSEKYARPHVGESEALLAPGWRPCRKCCEQISHTGLTKVAISLSGNITVPFLGEKNIIHFPPSGWLVSLRNGAIMWLMLVSAGGGLGQQWLIVPEWEGTLVEPEEPAWILLTGSLALRPRRASLWGNIGDRRLGARKSGFGVPAA